MANYLAVSLDRRGLAEMSCIAGVGGDVPKLVRVAKSGRRIVAIDGCALACVRNCWPGTGSSRRNTTCCPITGCAALPHDYDPDEAARVLDGLAASLARGTPPRLWTHNLSSTALSRP